MTDHIQEFSIKDLESYTGIKAHTIRIWEQRYGLLKPERTEGNIRKYSDKELKSLLNISLLNQRGHKISEIAAMNEHTIAQLIDKYASSAQNDDTLIATLKLAMLNFDEKLFNSIVELRIATHGLEHTYIHVLTPFLHQIGLLWLSNAICPAQEHFISNLIRQKIYAHTDKLGTDLIVKHEKTFVLYLPELEFHELSLIMLNFALRSRGYRTIYLGQSVPVDDLYQVYQRVGQVHYISQFTTQPVNVLLPGYLKKISEKFMDSNCEFHLTGGMIHGQKSPELGLIYFYPDLSALMQEVTA
jgi:MerR family transcriptional regulator, light-induced transcriptional regulator